MGAVHLAHEVHHHAAVLGIQVGGGFVRYHQARPDGQGAGDGHPLALAAGEAIRARGGEAFQAHFGQGLGGPLPGFRFAGASDLHGQHDVLQSREHGHQVEALEHEADALAAKGGEGVVVQGPAVLVVEPHSAVVRGVDEAHQVHEGGFAAARGAPHGHELPRVDVQGDAVQGLHHGFAQVEAAVGVLHAHQRAGGV